jgi:DNA helicase-2/ATP-dependent DNA helicase PcrA
LTGSINIKTQTLLPEDIGPVCYLDYLLNGKKPKVRPFEHVVIDEAQDVSPLEFMLISVYSSNKSFTILGDINQYLLPYHGISNWKEIAPIFAEEKPLRLDIRKGYRSTAEITQFSNHLLKYINHSKKFPLPYDRHGEKPTFNKSKSRSDMVNALVMDIESLTKENIKTIAVLCKTISESVKFKKEIEFYGIPISAADSKIQIGDVIITVSSIYEMKGLEFDAVLLANVGAGNYSNTDTDNTLLYLGATRAAHKLHIHWYGKITEALSDIAEADKKRKGKRIKKTGRVHKRKSDGSVQREKTAFNLPTFLTDKGLNFVDKRPQGGALWLIGGKELSPVIEELKAKGFQFSYTHKGGHASNYEPAWYSATKG